jgi:hypothetical protein
MTRISTTPRTGQFAGQIVFTNIEGEGIFSYCANGFPIQHTGTGQTPTFRSSRQLARWLREHYPTDEQAYDARDR